MRAGMASGKACHVGGAGRSLPCGCSDGPAAWPRKDALLEAERSHQRRRIELLDEQLDGALEEVRRLTYKLEDTEHLVEVSEEAGDIFTALRTPATRAQRAELALFESGITWYGRWDDYEG